MKFGNGFAQTAPESIWRNTAWLLCSGLLNIANGVVLWMLLARWRPPAEVGQFAAALGLYTIFLTLCSLGLSHYLAGETARRRPREQFVASAAALISVWSIVCAAAMAVTSYLVQETPAARLTTALLSLAVLPTGLISVGEAVFIGLGRARVVAAATMTENLLRTALPLWLLYRGYGLPALALAYVAARLAAGAVYAWATRAQLSALRQFTRALMREITVAAPTFAGVTVLAALHWQLGAILINRLGNETAAAEFGVAARFLLPVTVLLSSYVSVVQPEASRLALKAEADLREFLARCLRLVLALAAPLAVGGLLLGRPLLSLVFGPRYAAAQPALALLSLSIIPFSIVMVAARGLIATGRQRVDLLGNGVAVLGNALLNVLLIPRYGATGAAAAQLFSVTLMAAVVVGYGLRLPVGRALWLCRWPLLALSVVLLLARDFSFWWALSLGAAAYLLGLALIWRQIRPAAGTAAEKRPRILMVGAHPTKTIGGISTLINDILHSSLTRKFEFHHIASQADEYGKWAKLTLAFTALGRFVGELCWRRPQLVYVHIGGQASLYRKGVFIALARWAGLPVLAHIHAGNFEFYFAKQSPLGRQLILRGLGRSSRFIAVSQAMEQMLSRYWPEVPVTVVPNGIRTALFAGDRSAAARARLPVRLLFVGNMGLAKGEADLLRALQWVVKKAPSFRLDLLGQGAETVQRLCRDSGLAPFIDHLGPVPLAQRLDYFKRADVFVLPTYTEGLSVAILEAMAAGLPVISTTAGGNPELVEDGVEGYLIEPGDVSALSERLVRLLNDPEQRRLMGERAQLKAQRFELNLMLARLGMELWRQTGGQWSVAGGQWSVASGD